MRGSAVALGLAASTAALAGGFGTKDSPVTTSGSGGGLGMMPMFQMLLALGIVFALLKFALPKLAGKVNKKLVTGVNSGIQIEESANFAGGSLYIVRARHKTLLLSVNGTGVSCLSDLTVEKTEPEPLTFMEMVEQAEGDPNYAVVEEPTTTIEPDTSDIELALQRLQKLSS